MLSVFFMFIKNLECVHGCNMENFPAGSSRESRISYDTSMKERKKSIITLRQNELPRIYSTFGQKNPSQNFSKRFP